MWPFYNLAHWL